MSDHERRGSRRVTYYREAHLEGIDLGRANVRLVDVSVKGAFVDARAVLPAGAAARLRFTVLEREVSVLAEVCYSMPGLGMGLSFLDLDEADRSVLERFVAQHLPPAGEIRPAVLLEAR